MQGKPVESRKELSERARRKRYLGATIVSIVVLLMLGGIAHVIDIGSTRLGDMRRLSTYDPKDMSKHIRAAGEEITLHRVHEYGKKTKSYTKAEAENLLTKKQWAEVDTMVTIPAGPFIMGTNDPNANPQDHPRHRVVLPAYRIDKYPVTNAQYARFIAATGHRPPLDWKNGKIPPHMELKPVTMVDWYDARAYARWAGKRLPTEAEYEKAGRGPDGLRWPWGNKMDANRLNTYNNVGSATDVTEYANGASQYGVMGLSGNVDEWVENDFEPYAGTDAPSSMFQGKVGVVKSEADRAMKVVDMVPVHKRYKVLRGGSFKSDPFSTALYERNYALPNFASNFFGFRCAADIKSKAKEK